jgi:two-component system LytT family sensor kinase
LPIKTLGMKDFSFSLRNWMRYFGSPLFGIILYIVAFFLVSDESFDEYYVRFGGWAYLYDIVIAIAWSAINLEISFMVSDALDKVLPWTAKPFWRFFTQSGIQLCLTIVVVFGCLLSYVYVFQLEQWHEHEVSLIFIPTAILASLISLLVMGVNVGAFFFQRWQASQVETEQLKQANLENQIQILTQQLDPHFLFNNFNTLSSLIEENPKSANYFLSKMSDVYRYVLSNRDQKVVTLKEELEMIEAYTHLLKERFGEHLQLAVDIPSPQHRLFLPVLALQNLVENAVKHNIINGQHPLLITIRANEDSLIVENTFQPKRHVENSSKVGLKNIQDRYKLMSKKSIEVEKTSQLFRVTLPLLDL